VTIAPQRPATAQVSPLGVVQRIWDPYDPRANASNFDVNQWLLVNEHKIRLLNSRRQRLSRADRQLLTRLDPLLFAVVYLRHHLVSEDTGGRLTFADPHFEWARLARGWVKVRLEPREWRHSFAAPRACGKSTWWFTIIPIWAGAHGHVKFVAAFADSGTQSEMHLQTFRTEAQHNRLLRRDFPDLCAPIRKPTGKTVADNVGMFQSKSGFVFAARGANTASLGMKVGDRRPDVLICDDIEKDEALYSAAMVEKRLRTLIDAIFPLNERARVVIVGTVTRPNSINHQLVKKARGEEGADENTWIDEEKIAPHHYDPLIEQPDGTRRSIWPAKWTVGYLESIEHTRSYQKNMANNPRADSGPYWNQDDIVYGRLPNITRVYMVVDPPVTQGVKSDPCGIAILAYAPGTGRPGNKDWGPADELSLRLFKQELVDGGAEKPTRLSRVEVVHAEEVRLTGTPLKNHLLGLLARFPEIYMVILENNQGGDLWLEVMGDLPVPFKMFTSEEPKEVRMARALDYYQRNRVLHRKRLSKLEDQMTGFPKLTHDDVVDAVGTGVIRLLAPPKKDKSGKIEKMR